MINLFVEAEKGMLAKRARINNGVSYSTISKEKEPHCT